MNNKHAVIYVRYSPRPNAPIESVEMQRTACERFCELHGYDVLDRLLDEGKSAYKADQPGLMAARALLGQYGGGTIVAFKLSRLFRNVRFAVEEIAQCAEDGIHFRTVQDNIDTSCAVGRMVTTMLAAVAQLEAENRQEETKAAYESAMERGVCIMGEPPYGCDVDSERRLVPRMSEIKIIDRIMFWAGMGKTGHAIYWELKAWADLPRNRRNRKRPPPEKKIREIMRGGGRRTLPATVREQLRGLSYIA